MNTEARKLRALNLLRTIVKDKLSFLGEGASAVVFATDKWVYKVFLSGAENRNVLDAGIKFLGSSFFYELEGIHYFSATESVWIYPYEESEVCTNFQLEEMQDFLVDCWERDIVVLDIQPRNAVRVQGQLKWVDYEWSMLTDKLTDNLFLNMACRAYIYCKYGDRDKVFLDKLKQTAINQFDLKALDGLQEFLNRLYAKIIYHQSLGEESQAPLSIKNSNKGTKELRLPYQDDINPELLFFSYLKEGYYLEFDRYEHLELSRENFFSPKAVFFQLTPLDLPTQEVTLLIKACVQDTEVLKESVYHLLRQLSSPNKFKERILALDTRTTDFLRSYNEGSSWEELLDIANSLVQQGAIDRVIYPTENDVLEVNKAYFQLQTTFTHTVDKVPVAAQLYGLEQASTDYVFQLDIDAMIGRFDRKHSFLNDMIEVIENHKEVVSVGFNIYKGKQEGFTPYYGFENGGFVPEVRCCLLKKSRLKKILPLPNQLTDKGLALSWYRSLEQRQKETNSCSVRGGNYASFYIHIPNFKKKDLDSWFTMVDRLEQGFLPSTQKDEFDLVTAYSAWGLPQRSEKMVVVSCLRNISLARFLRFWKSLITQSNKDWGLILVDDASTNGLAEYIKKIVLPYKNRVTFIHNRFRVGNLQNQYKAIRYFIPNPNSIVLILDGDDALIGKQAIEKLWQKYSSNKADVIVGRMYRTDKCYAEYPYKVNFHQPRLYGGNVWQHLRSFKKYLFDSLTLKDLRIKNRQPQENDDERLAKRFSKKTVFPEYATDFAMMIPIVEMSTRPLLFDHFLVYHDRTTINTAEIKKRKEEIIAEILNKPAKTPNDVLHSRRTFLPNLNKIEIDITYACNLKCINCNRSSTQAPTKDGMSLAQIKSFVEESKDLGKKWTLINLLGGEPSVHPDFHQIVQTLLEDYIDAFSTNTILQVTSNGHGEFVQNQLSKLPKHPQLIIDVDSFKDSRVVPYFSPFNKAPVDQKQKTNAEYIKGCWVTAYCGIGLNHLGYYPCGVAAGIDRVFEFNKGIPHLKDVDESIRELLQTFCQFCGNFIDYESNKGDFIPRHEKVVLKKPIVSETWRKKYREYNRKK